ncbi:MAG TPA: pilus assembly PilX N-terminal domain-containing protein [Candidatus Paceibacterota bacterium]|jgi:Tfp pilus assembly protein PilE
MMKTPQRGFTLLIAIVLATVALAVGLALADVAYKQVLLSSAARQSQAAFYRADSALECALYYDQKFAAFNPTTSTSFDESTITCQGRPISGYTENRRSDGSMVTTFNVTGASCANGQVSAIITVYKETTGFCSTSGQVGKNCLYASGFNTCSSTDPNRFERELKAVY